MSNSTDFISKYFDDSFTIPTFSSEDLVGIISQIIDRYLSKQNFSLEQYKDINEQIKEKNTEILKNLKSHLTTIRMVKHFERKLDSNIQKLKRDIYFPDILLMSLIESTNGRLLNFIRNNREALSVSPASMDDIYSIFGITKIEELITEKNNLIKKLSSEEQNLIFALFPNIKFLNNYKISQKHQNEFARSGDSSNFLTDYIEVYQQIENKNRIALNVLLYRYFSSTTIDKTIELITNQDFKDEIIKSLSDEKSKLEKSISLLKQIFPPGNENFDLRKLSLSWVYDKIKKENLQIVHNLIIAMSFLAKDNLSKLQMKFFGLEEKKQAAFQTWHYLERKDSNKNILLDILDYEDNSDEFADNVLFYSIHKERTPKGIDLPDKLINAIAIKYLLRLNKKLKRSNSIFSYDFDTPISTIWRWHQALEFADRNKLNVNINADLSDYLKNSLMNNTSAFVEFFNQFVIQDFPDEKATFRPEELFKLMKKENVKTLINHYNSKKYFEELPYKYYQSMNEWLEYEKSKNSAEI